MSTWPKKQLLTQAPTRAKRSYHITDSVGKRQMQAMSRFLRREARKNDTPKKGDK